MAEFDLLVIGGGSGGVACARRAAGYGARAGVIENDRLGGTCVHRGCIPKKLLVYASHFSHDFEDAAGDGWSVGARSFDWREMVGAKVAELDRLEGIYGRLLDSSGAAVIRGTGRMLDANTVAVGDERHRAETIVIATGSVSSPLAGVDVDEERIVTSTGALALAEVPERMAVIGAGYIGLEMGSVWSRPGAKVTVIEFLDRILPGGKTGKQKQGDGQDATQQLHEKIAMIAKLRRSLRLFPAMVNCCHSMFRVLR